jgi:hypothetical protein
MEVGEGGKEKEKEQEKKRDNVLGFNMLLPWLLAQYMALSTLGHSFVMFPNLGYK